MCPPPPFDYSHALCHAKSYKDQGTLIVYSCFPYQTGILLPGRGWNNLGDSPRSDSSLLAVAFDFSKPPRTFNVGTLMVCVTDILFHVLGHHKILTMQSYCTSQI